MTRWTPGLLALATFGAGSAMAGGIDRAGPDFGLLFEEGRVLEFSAQQVTPDIKGTYLGGASTGNMAESFGTLSFGFKNDINDKLSYAVYVGQPLGADANYPSGGYAGLEAHWTTEEAAALLKYRLDTGVSVYGGLRYMKTQANIAIPAFAYQATSDAKATVGYVIGAAYEKPEIALRVGLTYSSASTLDLPTTEVQPALPGGALSSITEITLPQSLTLDGQTGIAADTLLFGQVRWAEWSKWHVKPDGFAGLTARPGQPTGDEITGFDHDFVTYTIGLGRKLSDRLSVFGALGYEAPAGGVSSILSPTDGMQSVSLGAVWTQDQLKVTTGVQYQSEGDTYDVNNTQFKGNHVLAFGVKMAYSF